MEQSSPQAWTWSQIAAPTAFLLIEQSGLAFSELCCAGQQAWSCEKRESNVIFSFDIFQHYVWEDFYAVKVSLHWEIKM